ncbi:sulfatase-like hydrolase/transferase [Rubrobacter tropicus]|nr:sulfatase-like hydrolase/transferase [Rubrobacter tropicus]
MTHALLILVDALRADHLGCYAGEDRGTPNADALAGEGVLFRNAVSQASWTRPSTASIMTGLYPSQTGLGGKWNRTREGRLRTRTLDPSIPTLAELVTAAGHATAFVGGNANLKPLFGITRGFTHNMWRSTSDGAVAAEDFERWLLAERPESSFCYAHFMDVHNPMPAGTIPARLDTGLDLSLVEESSQELMNYYAAAVRRADEHIGRVVRALKRARTLEETLIIVSADHGEELGEHGGMLSHGRTLYRETLNVPLIVRLPGGAFAGEEVYEPVQCIDFFPTVLEQLGCPPADVPGRSILPLIRGEEADGGAAFSEYLKPHRYGQSVTTRRHQYVQDYLLEETRTGSPDDLRPGVCVAVKGQPIRGGRFMATKVLIEDPEDEPTLSGVVDGVEEADGSVTVMGIAFEVDGATRFVTNDGSALSLGALEAGDHVTVDFATGPDGLRTATKIRRKAAGGKSKIWGPIEEARDLGAGLRSVTVLGMDVLIDGNVKVRALKNGNREERRESPVERVLAGDFIEVGRELYDIENDPLEARNIVDERPDVAQQLEETLALWTESLEGRSRTTTGDVDVDPETMEQLRLMGYVE